MSLSRRARRREYWWQWMGWIHATLLGGVPMSRGIADFDRFDSWHYVKHWQSTECA